MLSSEQVMIVGLVATVLTFFLKILAQYFGFSPNRGMLTVALYGVSLGLAGLWGGATIPTFPPFADPVTFVSGVLQFVADLLANVAPVVGIATLIYNVLYEKVVVPATNKLTK
jgi:hypothetical protein